MGPNCKYLPSAPVEVYGTIEADPVWFVHAVINGIIFEFLISILCIHTVCLSRDLSTVQPCRMFILMHSDQAS